YQRVRWSPDGRRLLALAATNDDPEGQNYRLMDIDISSGAEKPFPGPRWRMILDFNWLPDGSGILLAAQEKTAVPSQIWTVSYPKGTRRRISNDLSEYRSVSVSADGSLLAAAQHNYDSSLWIAASAQPDSAVQLTHGRVDGVNGLTWTRDNR